MWNILMQDVTASEADMPGATEVPTDLESPKHDSDDGRENFQSPTTPRRTREDRVLTGRIGVANEASIKVSEKPAQNLSPEAR